ncbi:MAG: SCO family protein [Rudaea sp.]
MRRCSPDPLRALAAFVLAAALVAPACAIDFTSAMKESQAAIDRVVDDYALTSADGRRVRMSDFRGKPLLVSFVYTGCSQICPATTRFLANAVKEANRALGPNAFNVVTIGFNLPFDNPAAMRQFARQQGIDDPQWTFLSPDAGSVEALTRNLGFVYAPSPSGFDHIAQVTLVDASGRVVRQIYGDTFDPQLLVGAVRATTTGAPGPLQDLSGLLARVRVLCSVYDPATGSYRLDYGLFIEIFAGLTVLGAVAFYIGGEWRRQRRTRRDRVAA